MTAELLPQTTSPQLATAYAWLKGFKNQDMDEIAAQLSDNSYEHHLLPASIGLPFSKSKKEWVTMFSANYLNAFKTFAPEVVETIEALGKIVFHFRSTAQSVTDGTYTNEYILILTFDGPADSPKICSVKEFVDSAYVVQFWKEEGARLAARAKANDQ